MTEPNDPTQLGRAPVEPTESHAVDYPPTGSGYAWGLAEDSETDDFGPARRFSPRAVTVAAVVASLVVVVGVAVFGGYKLFKPEPRGAVAAQSATPPAARIDGPTIDGIFRFDYADETVINGSIRHKVKSDSAYRAIRSACTPTGCVAVSVGMDPANPVKRHPKPGPPIALGMVDNQWREAPGPTQRNQPTCVLPGRSRSSTDTDRQR